MYDTFVASMRCNDSPEAPDRERPKDLRGKLDRQHFDTKRRPRSWRVKSPILPTQSSVPENDDTANNSSRSSILAQCTFPFVGDEASLYVCENDFAPPKSHVDSLGSDWESYAKDSARLMKMALKSVTRTRASSRQMLSKKQSFSSVKDDVLNPTILTGEDDVLNPTILTGEDDVLNPTILTGEDDVLNPTNLTALLGPNNAGQLEDCRPELHISTINSLPDDKTSLKGSYQTKRNATNQQIESSGVDSHFLHQDAKSSLSYEFKWLSSGSSSKILGSSSSDLSACPMNRLNSFPSVPNFSRENSQTAANDLRQLTAESDSTMPPCSKVKDQTAVIVDFDGTLIPYLRVMANALDLDPNTTVNPIYLLLLLCRVFKRQSVRIEGDEHCYLSAATLQARGADLDAFRYLQSHGIIGEECMKMVPLADAETMKPLTDEERYMTSEDKDKLVPNRKFARVPPHEVSMRLISVNVKALKRLQQALHKLMKKHCYHFFTVLLECYHIGKVVLVSNGGLLWLEEMLGFILDGLVNKRQLAVPRWHENHYSLSDSEMYGICKNLEFCFPKSNQFTYPKSDEYNWKIPVICMRRKEDVFSDIVSHWNITNFISVGDGSVEFNAAAELFNRDGLTIRRVHLSYIDPMILPHLRLTHETLYRELKFVATRLEGISCDIVLTVPTFDAKIRRSACKKLLSIHSMKSSHQFGSAITSASTNDGDQKKGTKTRPQGGAGDKNRNVGFVDLLGDCELDALEVELINDMFSTPVPDSQLYSSLPSIPRFVREYDRVDLVTHRFNPLNQEITEVVLRSHPFANTAQNRTC